MYTYMSICIYIKQKNTVCHIWFMCNTFSGCLKLVISSTLLCRGIAHVRCYWSCLPWIVAWSWWKDNVTSTFLTYCHISHLHWVLQATPTVTDTNTQVTLLTAHQLYQWSLPWGRQLVWLTASCTLSRPTPGSFSHTHTSVPLQLNMHTIMYLLLILTFLLLNGLFLVFHSMACAFFLLFLRIWKSMPLKKTTTTKKTCFQTVEGEGLGGEHNINQGRRSQKYCQRIIQTPHFILIFKSVWC